jgi:hypothetical protein
MNINRRAKPEPRFALIKWTQAGRDYQKIVECPSHAPEVACGTREAMEAAQRLLFPAAWEEHQEWRQHYYDLTGKMLWVSSNPHYG